MELWASNITNGHTANNWTPTTLGGQRHLLPWEQSLWKNRKTEESTLEKKPARVFLLNLCRRREERTGLTSRLRHTAANTTPLTALTLDRACSSCSQPIESTVSLSQLSPIVSPWQEEWSGPNDKVCRENWIEWGFTSACFPCTAALPVSSDFRTPQPFVV